MLLSNFAICCLCLIICIDADQVTLRRSIENKGFHRYLTTIFEFNATSSLRAHKYCEWLLVESLPSNVYVDRFELKNYQNSFLFSLSSSEISIEAAEYNSKRFEMFIFASRDTIKIGSFVIRVPFHLRYHAPGNQEYQHFNLTKPRLFLSQCLVDSEPLGTKLKLPCMNKQRAFIPFDTNKTSSDFSYLRENLCEWQEYGFNIANEELALYVPIGEQADRFLVTCGTVAFILASSLSTIYSIMQKH